MATPLANILQWWKKYAKPTAEQVAETFRSFRHKNDKIPTNEIQGLDNLLVQKADKEVLDTHLIDNVKHITNAERATWNDKLDANALNNIPINNITGLRTELSKKIDHNIDGSRHKYFNEKGQVKYPSERLHLTNNGTRLLTLKPIDAILSDQGYSNSHEKYTSIKFPTTYKDGEYRLEIETRIIKPYATVEKNEDFTLIVSGTFTNGQWSDTNVLSLSSVKNSKVNFIFGVKDTLPFIAFKDSRVLLRGKTKVVVNQLSVKSTVDIFADDFATGWVLTEDLDNTTFLNSITNKIIIQGDDLLPNAKHQKLTITDENGIVKATEDNLKVGTGIAVNEATGVVGIDEIYVDGKIANMSITHRNLINNSNKYIQTVLNGYYTSMEVTIFPEDLQKIRGKKITLSFDYEKTADYDEGNGVCGFYAQIVFADGTTQDLSDRYSVTNVSAVKGRMSKTYQIQDKPISSIRRIGDSPFGLYAIGASSNGDGGRKGQVKIGRPALVIGEKDVGWSLSFGDTQTSLSSLVKASSNTDASTKGVAVGKPYINSTTGVVTIRLT